MKATFHGHACFVLERDGKRVIIDPFLTGNPAAVIGPDKLPHLDAILLSHGHGDHLGDAVALSQNHQATIVATYELAQFCADDFPFGKVKLVPAFHGGRVEGDKTGRYTTNPAGVVVTIGGKTVYHTGDTGLTLEMQLLTGRIDLMLVPIGDNYTMGVEDAVRAVEFVKPKSVIPMHYNTWDLIKADPQEFRRLVGSTSAVIILKPGETYTLS